MEPIEEIRKRWIDNDGNLTNAGDDINCHDLYIMADMRFLLAEVDRLKADATTATFTNFHHYGGGTFSTDKIVVTGPGNLNLLACALDFAKAATVKDGVVEIRIDNATAQLLGERNHNERLAAQLARIKAALMAAGCSDYTDDVARMAEEYLAQPEEG